MKVLKFSFLLTVVLCFVFLMGCPTQPSETKNSDSNGSASSISSIAPTENKCIMVKAGVVPDSGNYCVEVQFDLLTNTDMSGEDYVISFDVYIPTNYIEQKKGFQFAFYDSTTWTPIYSGWWVGSIVGGQWISRVTNVALKENGGFIDYSGFDNNPDDWTNMTKVRFQYVTGYSAGTEVVFYLDNIIVSNKNNGNIAISLNFDDDNNGNIFIAKGTNSSWAITNRP